MVSCDMQLNRKCVHFLIQTISIIFTRLNAVGIAAMYRQYERKTDTRSHAYFEFYYQKEKICLRSDTPQLLIWSVRSIIYLYNRARMSPRTHHAHFEIFMERKISNAYCLAPLRGYGK